MMGNDPQQFTPAAEAMAVDGKAVEARKRVSGLGYFGRLLLCAAYFFLARVIAEHGARGLVSEPWSALVEQGMLVFLLVVGFGGFAFLMDGEAHPVSAQGLVGRPTMMGELCTGLAGGWMIALVCVLPMVFLGGIAMTLSLHAISFGWLVVDAGYFALGTLAMQVAFRGYPFQCAIRAMGELPASLMMAVFYGMMQAWLPGASLASMAVSVALGLLLAMAYLRTRALWLAWGLHLGWVGSRALLFGLTVKGNGSHSAVVQGDPTGPVWLTGGEFGLDGSWVAFLVILLAMPFVYRATRELSYHYNAPLLVPAGIPVDLDAAARRQHEVATREAVAEVKPLVQILPANAWAAKPVAADLAEPGLAAGGEVGVDGRKKEESGGNPGAERR